MKNFIYILLICLLTSCSSQQSKPRHISQYYKKEKTGYQYVLLKQHRKPYDKTQRQHLREKDRINKKHKKMIKKQKRNF